MGVGVIRDVYESKIPDKGGVERHGKDIADGHPTLALDKGISLI